MNPEIMHATLTRHKFNIFPEANAEDFDRLVSDIEASGYDATMPVTLYEGAILDGWNRQRACNKLGIKPVYTQFAGSATDAVSYTMRTNKRRNLTSSQWAAVAVEAEDILQAIRDAVEEERRAKQAAALAASLAAQRAAEQAEADRLSRQQALVDAAPAVSAVLAIKPAQVPFVPSPAAAIAESLAQLIAPNSKDERATTTKVATLFNTNRAYVQTAQKLKTENPAAFARVKSGEATITQVQREIKEEKREERREENRAKVAEVVEPSQVAQSGAKFATIVIDPPWDWGDEGDQDQLGRARPDYSTMSLAQLLDLPVGELADDDCHMYMWITNRSLPKGFQLLDRWGFRYITALTWVKPHFGMGNYFRGQTEHVLFGVKGSQALKRKDVGTVFNAPRGSGGHSSKPPAFYELVESCSPGPYLEMFSRSQRADWTTWGENANGSN